VGPDKTLGNIKRYSASDLEVHAGSRVSSFLAEIADAKECTITCKLRIHVHGRTFPRDSSGLAALADALREHLCIQMV
jgi:hypothetical protein